MQEIIGNLWDQKATVLCITTNGTLRKDGALVMGRGVAKQCMDRNPGVQFKFGQAVQNFGNIFQYIETLDEARILAAFPVKHNWWEQANLELIMVSALSLNQLALSQPQAVIILPRPGCGNGGLDWMDVKPVIEFLPNNVHVIRER